MSLSPARPASTEFEASAENVTRRLRAALAEVVAKIPGLTYRRPNDLAMELGIDAKLAWRIGRSISSSDHFASAQFFPGPTGMKTFLRAAERHAAPPPVLEEVRSAFEAFRGVVRAHAGSRKYFDILAAGLAKSDHARGGVEHRRQMFEGSTYVWGLQARTIFRVSIVHPSADERTYDMATVRGFVDLCRMRPNVPWRIALSRSVDDSHAVHTDVCRTAIDPRATGPVPLLTEFCTERNPQFRTVIGAHGLPEFELVESSVGNTARATYVTGELLRSVEPRYSSALYQDFCVMFSVRTPAESLVFDVLIHRSLFGQQAPVPELYSDLFGGGPTIRYEPSDRLPLHETLECLGQDPDMGFTADVPRYPELLRRVFECVGWQRNEFNLYRLRMQYPPLPTTLMMREPLPAGPDRF